MSRFSSPTIAIEDVDAYTANSKAWFDYLNELANAANDAQLKDTLGFLFVALRLWLSSSICSRRACRRKLRSKQRFKT